MRNPLKVLVLSRDSRSMGGVVNYLNILTAKLAKSVSIQRLYVGSTIENRNVIRRTLKPIADGFKLFLTLKKERYDVIQINPSLDLKSALRDGLFMLVFKLCGRSNVLLFFRGWDEEFERTIRNNGLYTFCFRWVFGRAARILVLSTRVKTALVSMGFNPDSIEQTTTMYCKEIFNRQTPPFERKPRTILFMARMVKAKGIYELVRAFKTISASRTDTKMIIAGDGPERANVESYVEKLGLAHMVSFPGYLRGAAKGCALHASDIFVLPSYTEGCPNSLLEAMGAGCAVIVTPVGGIPDVVEEDVNGIFVKVKNCDDIAVALAKLLNDEAMTARMKRNNYLKAREQFEACKVAGKIHGHYKSISGACNDGRGACA